MALWIILALSLVVTAGSSRAAFRLYRTAAGAIVAEGIKHLPPAAPVAPVVDKSLLRETANRVRAELRHNLIMVDAASSSKQLWSHIHPLASQEWGVCYTVVAREPAFKAAFDPVHLAYEWCDTMNKTLNNRIADGLGFSARDVRTTDGLEGGRKLLVSGITALERVLSEIDEGGNP